MTPYSFYLIDGNSIDATNVFLENGDLFISDDSYTVQVFDEIVCA